ncbi:MAG: transglutaminase family protein [Ferruginibacter sp.]
MLYSIIHNTTYRYHETVPQCHNIAILTPRDTAVQSCLTFSLDIKPEPAIIDEYIDFFGNKVFYFAIEQEHESLSVTATSIIEKNEEEESKGNVNLQSWEEVRNLMHELNGNYLNEKQYTVPSDITFPDDAIRAFAAQSFTPNRPLFETVQDLMNRIYTGFKYTAGFTTVSTPLSVVMKERKGVCQDFAHLGISCMHAMGIPARYISGYLETTAPEGKEKLVGADASHAWFSVFIPGMGWVDFDPTNNKIPGEQYITIGWGRHYFDVIPLRGVITSSHSHALSVSVDVKKIEENDLD